MDIIEVIELMSMVDSMENIEEVTVTLGDNPSVTIKKKTQAKAADTNDFDSRAGIPQRTDLCPKTTRKPSDCWAD